MNLQLQLKKFVESSIDIKVNKFFKLSFIKDEAFVIWTDGLGNHKQSLGFTKDNPLLVQVKHIWDEINDIFKYHFKSGLVYIYATPQTLQFGLQMDVDIEDILPLPKTHLENTHYNYISIDVRGFNPNHDENYSWLENRVKDYCNQQIDNNRKKDVRYYQQLLDVFHTIQTIKDSSTDSLIDEMCNDLLKVQNQLTWFKTQMNNKIYFQF